MATTETLVHDGLNERNELTLSCSDYNGLQDENLNSEDLGKVKEESYNEHKKSLSSSLTHSTDSLEKTNMNDFSKGALGPQVSDEVVMATDCSHGSEDMTVSGDTQTTALLHCDNDSDGIENFVDSTKNHYADVECQNTDAWIQTDLHKSASEAVLTSSKAIQMPSLSGTPTASPAHGQSLPKKHSSLHNLKAVYNSVDEDSGNCVFDDTGIQPKKRISGVKARRYSANDERSKGAKYQIFERREIKAPKNYHKDCIPHSEGNIQNQVKRGKIPSPRPNYLGVSCPSCNNGDSQEKLSNGSDSSGTIKSPDGKPDWVVFEKDQEKLTNAQKSLMAKKLFAASHYKFGLTSVKGNSQKKDGQIRLNSEKQQEINLKTQNGKGIKHDSSIDLTKLKFTYDVDPNPYSPLPGEKYLTPLQQREKQVKELNRQIKELQQLLRERDIEIQYLTEEMEQQIEFLSIEKDHTVSEIRELHDYDMGQLREKHAEEIAKMQEEFKKSEDDKNVALGKLEGAEKIIDENKKTIAELEDVITQMKKDFEEKEQVHRDRYLEMYRKGQMAQEMEMEENMILEAAKNPQNKAYKGLLKKLDKTEEELEKLKETRRHEIYSQGWQINSDPEAVIQLVRSTVYYYLIDRQPMANLSALLSILDYTEVQRRAIVETLKKKRK